MKLPDNSSSSYLRLGRWGEKIAALYLYGNGYSILEANNRTPYGEIDLIVRKDQVLVFVEVKTRRSHSLGLPEISITAKKLSHMVSSAEYFLQTHPEFQEDWRIDVISIIVSAEGNDPEVTHFENVTSAYPNGNRLG